MRHHRSTLIAVATAAIAALAIETSAAPLAAADKPRGPLSRPAGEIAAQVGSRLVVDSLSTPGASATADGAVPPPGGVTVALSSLIPPVVPAPAVTTTTAASPTSAASPTTAPSTTTAASPTTPATAPAPVPVLAPLPTPQSVMVGVPAAGVWAELRQCESGGNYATDTGNGYYGAYQFAAATWHGLGYPGLPNQAAPAVQDQAAERLQARSGWGQWPACSRKLGL